MRQVRSFFRKPPRPASQQTDPVTDLFRIAAVLLLLIVLLITVVSHPQQNVWTSMTDLFGDILPNFAALLLTYLIGSTILERRGISPQQRMLAKIVSDVTASVKPVEGIRDLHPLITQTPYGNEFRNAIRVQMVGRWYNETLTRYPDDLRAFFAAGGVLELVLMDAGNEATVGIAARQYWGQRRPGPSYTSEVISKAVSTIEVLRRACDAAGTTFEESVSVLIYPDTMNYWGIRFEGTERDSLYFAPYDNFRKQTLACPTVVFDLGLSSPTHEFWTGEFAAFVNGSVPLREWAISKTCADIRNAMALGANATGGPLEIELEWVYAEEALSREGFSISEDAPVANTANRKVVWEHEAGCVDVLLDADDRVIDANWVPHQHDQDGSLISR